jgi:hypothetical protein
MTVRARQLVCAIASIHVRLLLNQTNLNPDFNPSRLWKLQQRLVVLH